MEVVYVFTAFMKDVIACSLFIFLPQPLMTYYIILYMGCKIKKIFD
jgi:hypothetical protein